MGNRFKPAENWEIVGSDDARAVSMWIIESGLKHVKKSEIGRVFKGRWATHKGRREYAIDRLISDGFLSEPYKEETTGRPAITYTVMVKP